MIDDAGVGVKILTPSKDANDLLEKRLMHWLINLKIPMQTWKLKNWKPSTLKN